MPPKIVLVITLSIAATTLGLGEDTSIRDNNLQIVIMDQIQAIVDQLIGNGQALKVKLNKIGVLRIKIPSIKWFNNKKIKLKGFLIQI